MKKLLLVLTAVAFLSANSISTFAEDKKEVKKECTKQEKKDCKEAKKEGCCKKAAEEKK